MNLGAFPSAALVEPGVERNVLACIIKSSDAWLRLSPEFGVEEFEIPLNKALWTVVDHLYSKGASVDPILIHESLPREYQQELEDLGGWSYIQVLLDLPLDPGNVEYESRKLLELSTRRRIAQAGNKIQQAATSVATLDEVRESIEIAINEIDKEQDGGVSNIAVNGLEFLEKKMANPSETPGLPSGFPFLDKITQGFQPGRLYVVGARKKVGKSCLLLNWAKHLAVDLNIPILWISTEHTIEDEYSRLLSMTSGVFELSIQDGTFSQVETHVQRVADANERIEHAPFHFANMPWFSLEKIQRMARRMVRMHGVRIVFFDFIKTPESNANMQEWQELGRLAYGLKALAVTERVPVVSAAQINREGAQSFKLDGEIDSDYFSGSDRIAQALSVAWVLRPPTTKEAGDPEQFRVLRCADNRHGPSGTKYLLDFKGDILTVAENKRL